MVDVSREHEEALKPMPAGRAPSTARSSAMQAMAGRAAEGRFSLQSCTECNHVTYPPRDVCPKCWGMLVWKDQVAGAQLLSETVIRVTPDPYFRDHLPWRIGKLLLDAGPVALAHLHGQVRVGDRATMRLMLDRAGNAVLFALPEDESVDLANDAQYREFIAKAAAL